MFEPMQPSADAAKPQAPAAAAAQDQGNEDFEVDEFIINSRKVPLLQKNVERIQHIFQVTILLGLRAVEDVEIQWVSIQGLPEDRAMSKSYIKALCSPGNVLAFNFPDELHPTLSRPEIHAHLEKASNTAILFPSVGQAIIQGEDDLSVTLAMSAIEDMIQRYHDINIPELSSPTSTGDTSDRLDRELRRLSNQNKELYGGEFDVETLASLPGAVKRTLVKQYMYDSRQSSVDESKADTSFSRDPDQTVPMTLMGVDNATSISSSGGRFVNLHPEKLTAKKDSSHSSHMVNLHPSAQNTSLSLSLHLSDNSDACIGHVIDLTEESSPAQRRISPLGSSANSRDNQKSTVKTTTSTQPAPIQSLVSEAITFALNSGYSREEIGVVQKDYGDILTTAQFLQVLHTNRREKTQKHALTVEELELAHVPRPPPPPTPPTPPPPPPQQATATSSDSSVQEDNKEATTSTGKHHQTHNHGPKMKKGKLAKDALTKQRVKKSRWSPTEENTEKLEVVNLSDSYMSEGEEEADNGHSLPKPLHDILQNSPRGQQKQPQDTHNKARVADYLQRLTQDYDGEDSQNVDELRKNNTARRALLKQALELEKRPQAMDLDDDSADSDVEEISKGEWVTVEKDGRHRFSKLSTQEEVNKQGQEVTHSPSKKGTATLGTHVESKDTRRTEVVSGNLDALDDFSLPVGGDVEVDSDGYKPKRLQQHQHNNGRNQQWQKRGQYFKPNNQRNSPNNHKQAMHPYSNAQPHNAANNFHPDQPHHGHVGQLNQRHPAPHHQLPPLMAQQPQPLMTNQLHANTVNKLTSNLHYVVIDGSNVAMTHGNHQFFSCKGIKICIDYFRRRGHKEVTAFVPQWRTHAPRPEYPIRDQHMLEELRKEGCLVFTPARRVPGKNIVCYDDKFVLRLAQETDGIVVSNDNYRDLWNEKREWRQIIEYRLLMFSFVGDIFMAPEDPLGRDGPTLDEFLRKSNNLIPTDFIGQQQGRQQGPNVGPNMGNTRPYHNRPNHLVGPQGNRPVVGRYQNPGYAPRQPDPGQYQMRTAPMQTAPNPCPPTPYQGQPTYGHQGMAAHFGQQPNNQFNQERRQWRPSATTEWLKKKLLSIFPDCEAKMDQVLSQHSTETDINRITEYMLEDE